MFTHKYKCLNKDEKSEETSYDICPPGFEVRFYVKPKFISLNFCQKVPQSHTTQFHLSGTNPDKLTPKIY